jgi:hypothetical protein
MSNLRCKVGDLAIVTKCGVPERIGLLVRVVERCTYGDCDWLAEVQGRGTWGRDRGTGKLMFCRNVLCRDWNLTPIRGEEPFEQDVTEESEVGHA